ncbi:glycosyltransferase involved in cell wall biosynthesis [Leifsonia soli]|uniref:Glycosyltransferase involved in cell wall biosynthesis n=1 Tax=Leifsonia soli TaxID=582665 RepID=A0A852SUI8_9MICO|nr:glycosyltransferase involved in cell wall biosynthesis [Leifsonia soli]
MEQQLRSILQQTHPVDEVVVADDGSGDDTLAVVERVFEGAGGTPRLVVLPGVGRHGVTANFERAILATTGDLIALCDQDDVWRADKIERMAAIFEDRPDLLLAYSDARLIDAAGRDLGGTLFGQLEVDDGLLARIASDGAFPELLRRNTVTGATVVFRRALVADAAPFPELWVHDEWLAILAAALGSVRGLGLPLIDYRQHGANQIGVQAPTVRRKIARVLQARGDRNRNLWRRSELLRERLILLSPRVRARDLELVDGKLRHEKFRAQLPGNRVRRVIPVLREAATGRYARFASRGNADIFRDLLQPS